MYGSTGGYGGFSIFWVIVAFAAPVVGTIINGGLPDGTNSSRVIPPILLYGGGFAIALMVGTKWLQDRVRREEEEGPKPGKLDIFAQEIGLLPEVDDATKRPKLTGKRGQVWLAVHLERRKIRIVARHNLKLPAGFQITNTGKKPVQALSASQGGVVLGKALQFEGTDAMAVAWNHPDVASALMATLHPYPGSRIDHKTLTIDGAGMKRADIVGHIDEIVRLVAVLKSPPQQDITAPKFPGS